MFEEICGQKDQQLPKNIPILYQSLYDKKIITLIALVNIFYVW